MRGEQQLTNSDSSERSSSRYSRRRFLGALGAGAAGTVAAGPGAWIGTDAQAATLAPTSRSDRFGRMFPGLQPFAEATPSVTDALMALGAKDGPIDARDDMRPASQGGPGPLGLILNPGRNQDSNISAGTTFLGQFVDHDITFDLHSRLGVPTPPESSPNGEFRMIDFLAFAGVDPASVGA